MATTEETARPAVPAGAPAARRPATWLQSLRHLTWQTIVELFHDRVTGLAAEAAFWALLSLPPLVIGVLGTLGYFHSFIGTGTLDDIRQHVLSAASTVLSDRTVSEVVQPTLDDVLRGGRATVVSIGFLLSLWSGSRAMNVYVDAITIAYELHGIRGIVRSRLVGFAVYIAGVVIGIAVLPLLVIGPRAAAYVAPIGLVNALYWPVVVVVTVSLLATLYHVSVPVRHKWRRDLPGAVLAVGLWLLGSFLLRLYLGHLVRSDSAYGALGAPVAVLLWLYVTALAVLVGAELNAEIDKLWPSPETAEARLHSHGDADIGARISLFGRRAHH